MKGKGAARVVGNLGDLADTGLASEPTLRKWISEQPDQPWILKRGKNGDAYEIDIAGAIEAWRENERIKRDQQIAQAEQIKQISLDMGLVEVGESDLALTAVERLALMNEEIARFKIEQIRGTYVRRDSAEAAFGDVLVKFRERMRAFSGRLSKKIDLDRSQIDALDNELRTELSFLAAWMEDMDLSDEGRS